MRVTAAKGSSTLKALQSPKRMTDSSRRALYSTRIADALTALHNARRSRREETNMAGKQVKYYFAFPSPFAALADSRIDDLMARSGAELVPIPIVPPPAEPPTGIAAQIAAAKLSYLLEDAQRWAHKLGLKWQVPAQITIDSTDAAAGYYFAREKGKERGYRNAVFRARWGEGRNIADREVLAECAVKVGLARAEFLAALDNPRYRDEVPKALMLCMEDKIFGVPIFIVDGKRYWGNDRLDFLAEALIQ